MTTSVGRLTSGIPGLDAMLGGGLPRGRTTLVLGGPGAGKTLFALQVLAEGVRRFHEPGIFVSFEEDPARIRDHISGFPWAPTRAAARRRVFIDGRPIRTALHSSNFERDPAACRVQQCREVPERALRDGILVTPTLVRPGPVPVRVVGSLSDQSGVRAALGLEGA